MTQNVNMGAPAPAPKQSSWLPKVLIGCGVALVVFIIACVVAGWLFYRKGSDLAKEIAGQEAAEFVDQGFVKATEEPTGTVDQKTVFVSGILFTLDKDTTADVAIVMGGMATVKSHVGGTLFFRGTSINITPEAVIDGDLDVAGIQGAQAMVQMQGTVNGQITGNYQLAPGGAAPAMTDEAVPAEPVEPDDMEAAPADVPAAPAEESVPVGQSEPVAPEPAAAPEAPAAEPAAAPEAPASEPAAAE
jgi:hypothetical protein